MAPARDTSGVIAQLTRHQQHRARSTGSSSPALPGRFADNNSTFTSFQPEQESTQQFDTAADEPSDVSRVSNENEENSLDESQSVEIGRGMPRRSAFVDEYSEDRLYNLGDNSLYNLIATPPAQSRSIGRRINDTRKEAISRRATQERDADITKTSDIVPPKPRAAQVSGRRTLSDMHAKVNAISDSSFIQPETYTSKPRSSRFAGGRTRSDRATVPSKFTAGSGLHAQSVRATSRPEVNDDSLVGNQTAQSFMLPNLPNIAELVSGTRKDGTPVFSRTQPRSRFVSSTQPSIKDRNRQTHAQISTIALPDEEKAIFTSLQLLKEKVTQLESEKAAGDRQIEEYENELSAVRAQVQMERRLRRPDSGFGTDEERSGGTRTRVEQAELEASLKAAQDRLQRSERKASGAELAVKKVIQERDSLITQLGVAFYSNEELKETNAQLTREVELLREQKEALQEDLAAQQAASHEIQEQLQDSEKQHDLNLRRWAAREAELKARYKQRSAGIQEDQPRTVKSAERRRSTARAESQNKIMERVEQEVRKARAEAIKQSEAYESTTRQPGSPSRSRSRSHGAQKRRSKRHSIPAAIGVESAERWLDGLSEVEFATTGASRHAAESQRRAYPVEQDDSQEVTQLSFLDPTELAALRRKLEAERQRSKQGEATTAVPRKSSMRDMTEIATATRNVRVQSPATADAISYSGQADDHETGNLSILSTASKRPIRTKSFEEMTSAFILPDITMRASLTTNASTVPTHDPATCTACPNPTTLPIPSPISMSDRDMDNTTATVRPAEDPKAALAAVLKQLQDEIVHLKLALNDKECAYAAHDPAMGKRKRTALKEEMQRLIGEVERRSEWVYRLFDVVEGQKAVGGVEDTLKSLGVDVELGRGKGRNLGDEESVGSVDVVGGTLAY